MGNTLRSTIAELIGTFTLVLIGAGAGDLMEATNIGVVGVALAHGIALMVIIYSWGSISGAHVNPAVTLGVLLAGRMEWTKAVFYWVAQFAGAAAAAYLLLYLLVPNHGLGATKGVFTPTGGAGGDPTKLIVVEAVLTFFLVVAVFASGVQGRNGNMAGIAIGFVLTMDILFSASLTGGSMNPARTFGPALAMKDMSYFWMYLVGPMIGGAVGGLFYDRMFLPVRLQPPVEAAEDRSYSRR